MTRPPAWLITHGGAFVIGACAAFWFTDLYHSNKAAQLRAAAEHAQAEAAKLVIAEQNRSAASMAEADRTHSEKVDHVVQENDRLARCIAAGAGCGLRVRVARPACVPEAATPAGVGDQGGEWAELDGSARQDYFALRARLVTVEQALKLCVSEWPR